MLEPVKNIARKVRKLKEAQMLSKIMKDKLLIAQIIDLNTESQLYEKGVDSKGKELGEYAPITVSYFKPKAQAEGRDGRTDHVTLKDSGAFYLSFKVKRISGGIVIIANTKKDYLGTYLEFDERTQSPRTVKDYHTDLVVEFGPILGLTDESLQEILPEIRARISELVRLALAA